MYLVFIFLREGLVARRVADVLGVGRGSPAILAATLMQSRFCYSETGSTTTTVTRRTDPIRLANYRFTVLYTEIFVSFSTVRTLFVVCEVAFVLVYDEVL